MRPRTTLPTARDDANSPLPSNLLVYQKFRDSGNWMRPRTTLGAPSRGSLEPGMPLVTILAHFGDLGGYGGVHRERQRLSLVRRIGFGIHFLTTPETRRGLAVR